MINKIQIKICLGSSCFSRGNKDMVNRVHKYIRLKNIEDRVAFSGDHCTSDCPQGPNIRINGRIIHDVTEENIEKLLDENLNDIL